MKKLSSVLAENIKLYRAGMTQEKLAEKSGLSLGAIKLIETEKRWPSEATLGLIAEALGVSPSDLFVEIKDQGSSDFINSITRLSDTLNQHILIDKLSKINPDILDKISRLEEREMSLLEIAVNQMTKGARKPVHLPKDPRKKSDVG